MVNINLVSQFVTFDGLLAGFALAIAVQLLTHDTSDARVKKIIPWALGLVFISALFLIGGAYMGGLVYAIQAPLSGNSPLFELTGEVKVATYLFVGMSMIGMIILLTGVSIAGWIWSDKMGGIVTAATTILLLIIACVTLFIVL